MLGGSIRIYVDSRRDGALRLRGLSLENGLVNTTTLHPKALALLANESEPRIPVVSCVVADELLVSSLAAKFVTTS
jgi:hypothetical protein